MARVRREILAQREAQAWNLRQKLYTHQRIAEELGVDRSTVTKMLFRITARVNKELDDLIIEHKLAQVDQLAFVADEALQAWNRSKEAQKSVGKRTLSGSGGFKRGQQEEVTIQTEDQDGNPKYLTEARAALADIRKVLGLDAPNKIAPTDPTGKEAWAGDVISVVVHE